MPTFTLQLSCLAIVLAYVLIRLWVSPNDRVYFLRDFTILVLTTWVAEDTAIRLYGYYGYHEAWWLFIDKVPILIVLIWPVVIYSAYDLARALVQKTSHVVWLTTLVVTTDAALIEPIAIHVGLWAWVDGGMMGAPPIGVLGWSVVAASAAYFLSKARWLTPWMLVATPVAVHLALVALWWGLFKHIAGPWPDALTLSLVSLSAVAVILWILRSLKRRPSIVTVMQRAPGAGFFFVLLGIYAQDHLALWAYAIAFGLPWLVLVSRSGWGGPYSLPLK